MTCKTCSHWQIRPTHRSDDLDAAMSRMGYRNCMKQIGATADAHYFHGDAKGCSAWQQAQLNAA